VGAKNISAQKAIRYKYYLKVLPLCLPPEGEGGICEANDG
jgi:hypothetical protein